jgi:uncharacterized membrane protein
VKFSFLSKSRIQEFKILLYLSLFAFLVVFFRYILPNYRSLGFLLYNLFLAYIPLILSTYIRFSSIHINGKTLNWSLVFIWLIFYPNAPYIMTDRLHVMGADSVHIIIDTIIWVYIALIAFWIGLLSLNDLEVIVLQQKMPPKLAHICIVAVVLLSAYGIYLGRDLRLNSWDIVLKPLSLIDFILKTFTDTSPGFFNWKAVFYYSFVIYFAYVLFKLLKKGKYSNIVFGK